MRIGYLTVVGALCYFLLSIQRIANSTIRVKWSLSSLVSKPRLQEGGYIKREYPGRDSLFYMITQKPILNTLTLLTDSGLFPFRAGKHGLTPYCAKSGKFFIIALTSW